MNQELCSPRWGCECRELGRMLDIHNIHCPRFEEQETARLAALRADLDAMQGLIRVPKEKL